MVTAFRVIRWSALLVPLLILGTAPRLDAQKWVDSRYPYISSGANDFPMLSARLQWTRPVDDYFSPYAYEGNLSLDITFESMDDFSPAAVARKVDSLNQLLEARSQLSNLITYMDGKAGAEELIAKVLNDPALLKSLAAAKAPDKGSA